MNRWYLWVAAVVLSVGCAKSYDPTAAPDPATKANDPWVLQDLSARMILGPSEKHALSADFGQTRSSVSLNEAGTSASTKWSAGDTFEMYGYDSEEDALYYAPFTTEQGGVAAHFSTEYGLPDSAPYDVFYPGVDKYGFADESTLVYGVNLPVEQSAVPGGVADNLMLSYASAANMTDGVHFRSLVSLVRFRMSGNLVSRVKQVSIKGTTSLAGDAIAWPDGEGFVEVMQDIGFSEDVHSRTVTLTGDFVAGQDYYLVLLPGTQAGFQMVFSDGEGHSMSKTASEFTFPRGGISDFGTIDLGSEFTDVTGDTTPVLYMKATAGALKPVTIAVIPEGFTADELDMYEMLAKSGIDALFATEPFNHYREYFNVWILKVASNESGANITDGNGNITTKRDCYFGSKWGEDSYDDMQAEDNVIYEFVSQNCPDIKQGIHTVSEVPVLMIINDTRYGGICRSWSNGKGYCMAPYSYAGAKMAWGYPEKEAASVDATPRNTRKVTNEELQEMGQNIGDWRNTLVHEFGGHCFSRLADEYWYDSYKSRVSSIEGHNWAVPYSLNISATSSNPGWKSDLLDKNNNVLSSLTEKDSRYGRIGVYQGAEVSMFYRWRSERVSCMIDNRFYFSTWQRMIIVKRIMTLSGSTFDKDVFWAKDDPTDPLRDVGSNAPYHQKGLAPIRTVPMLPPPVLQENYVEVSGL